ncbi:MAG: thermonuclease family protein [Candidatus Edwardsbacteria bacterium]
MMIKKFLVLLSYFLTFSLSYAVVNENNHPYIDWSVPHKTGVAKIVSNYDGDTLTTSQKTKIRLLGVNTPEIKPKEQGGKEAKDFTREMVGGQDVDIVVMNDYQKDKYGRTLALIFVDDKCLNWELLKSKLAEPMVFREATILKKDMWENSLEFRELSLEKKQNLSTLNSQLSTHYSGWARLTKPKEEVKETVAVLTQPVVSVSTPTARAVLTQPAQQPLTQQTLQTQQTQQTQEALVMAFGGKQIIPKPVAVEHKNIRTQEHKNAVAPKVVVGNVLIEPGKSYRLRLITSGQGQYVLEVVTGE